LLHAHHENQEDFLGSGALPLVNLEPVVPKDNGDAPKLESRLADLDEDADTGKDSGNESAEAESDTEDKKESIKAMQNAMVGMNVSEIKFSRALATIK